MIASFIKRLFAKKNSAQEDLADFHTTIIRVDDNFVSTSSIILDESLMGNIYSLKEVIVTEKAQVNGNIVSRTASVSGQVEGDIVSTKYAEIKGTAVVRGNIRAKSISIAGGAIINGYIRIEREIDEHDLLEKVEKRLPAKTPSQQIELKKSAPVESKTDFEPKELSSITHEKSVKADPPNPSPIPHLEPRAREGEGRASGNGWY